MLRTAIYEAHVMRVHSQELSGTDAIISFLFMRFPRLEKLIKFKDF